MLKVDLHLHTADDPVDRISYSSPALIDRAVALGFDALAITLHDHQLDDRRLRDYARERGVLLIPGVERTVDGRHVLLINFSARAVERVRSLDDLASIRASERGLVIAPHPFFPGGTCLGAVLDDYAGVFDAVEWSYFWTPPANFNAAAARWASRHGKPLVGNSDLHDMRQFGRTYSLVDAPRDAAAICEAIRAGQVRVRTSPAPVLEMAGVFTRMILRPRRRLARAAGDLAPLSSGGAAPTL